MSSAPTVIVVGLGYVGCVSAACLAKLGHRVIGVDRDTHKVNSVLESKAPFYEPGLEEIVTEAVSSGRLSAVTSLDAALTDGAIVLLCVGTPSAKNGNLSLEQMLRVAEEISAWRKANPTAFLTVAVRSTVFPGTCENDITPALGGLSSTIAIVSNPEFLREGAAVKDFFEPSLVVVGGEDPAAVERVASIYAPLNVPPCLVSLRTAEMIKYACNAFHAVKISFANEIGTLANTLGVNPHEVMDTLCRDEKLNTSAAYLKPGFAFGGSCLPKDLRALLYRSSRLDLNLPMLESILDSNHRHLDRATQAVLEVEGKKIGIFGLAFKENTDDLRESPVVIMLEQLIGKGRDLRIFDPHIKLDLIYGSNQRYLLSVIPHIGRLMEPELDTMLAWADQIVIAQKPSPAFAERLRNSGLPILDLVHLTTEAAKPLSVG